MLDAPKATPMKIPAARHRLDGVMGNDMSRLTLCVKDHAGNRRMDKMNEIARVRPRAGRAR
jgi:hypothetical protein